LQNGEDEKEKEEETNYMDYIKPAIGALVGVLGGLLLAKAVKKNCQNDKKRDGHWRLMIIYSSFFFLFPW